MPEVDHFLGTSAYAQIGDLLAAEASPRQVIPDPDYIHDADDAADQLAARRTPRT